MGWYRKRPVEVEAVLFRAESPADAREFAGICLQPTLAGGWHLWVEQSHAWVDLEPEHWIIAERTEPGGFFPCSVQSFDDAYEDC